MFWRRCQVLLAAAQLKQVEESTFKLVSPGARLERSVRNSAGTGQPSRHLGPRELVRQQQPHVRWLGQAQDAFVLVGEVCARQNVR